ncbi:MAG: PKD domain-containing protein, partial [Planctomycetes bacterium]|nr:PKD domain-containing protein [Planctomycetota bacterium]
MSGRNTAVRSRAFVFQAALPCVRASLRGARERLVRVQGIHQRILTHGGGILRDPGRPDLKPPHHLEVPMKTALLAAALASFATAQSGLTADFTSDRTSGPSPLHVAFYDTSHSSAPGGVLAWAWDFDEDGVPDSSLQNPTWNYPNCGDYDVTLTVFDAMHPPATLQRAPYIRTDLCFANFVPQATRRLTVQFLDRSSVAASTWSWDLDGD